MQIITTTELQRNPKCIGDTYQIITNRGKPKSIAVPYFEGGSEWIEEYLENYEIMKNKETLKKKLQTSKESGLSTFSI